jgi:hypothetical protein
MGWCASGCPTCRAASANPRRVSSTAPARPLHGCSSVPSQPSYAGRNQNIRRSCRRAFPPPDRPADRGTGARRACRSSRNSSRPAGPPRTDGSSRFGPVVRPVSTPSRTCGNAVSSANDKLSREQYLEPNMRWFDQARSLELGVCPGRCILSPECSSSTIFMLPSWRPGSP